VRNRDGECPQAPDKALEARLVGAR
jgi:hypothetical protein